MKLVPKLSLAFIVGTTSILAVNGVLRVRREVAQFERDRAQGQAVLGRSVAAAASATWWPSTPRACGRRPITADRKGRSRASA